MRQPKAKRQPWRGGPPAAGSALSGGGISFSLTDIQNFADAAGLSFEGDASAAATALSQAIEWYVLEARMQDTRSERATAPEWARALAQWAAKGRVLLGDDESPVVHLTRASVHLANSLPLALTHEEATLVGDMFMALGLQQTDSTDLTRETIGHTGADLIAVLITNTAYALRVLQQIGKNPQLSSAKKGKQVDYARLVLVKNMKRIFRQLFPATPFNVRTSFNANASVTAQVPVTG